MIGSICGGVSGSDFVFEIAQTNPAKTAMATKRPIVASSVLLLILLAAFVTLVVALMLLQFTATLNNYWLWTITFAAARRTPARTEMLQIYEDKFQLLWIGTFIIGAIVVVALIYALLGRSGSTMPTPHMKANVGAVDRPQPSSADRASVRPT